MERTKDKRIDCWKMDALDTVVYEVDGMKITITVVDMMTIAVHTPCEMIIKPVTSTDVHIGLDGLELL